MIDWPTTRRLQAHHGLLLVMLLVAFAVRVWRLDAQSIWWDEGISLHLAGLTLADILADRIGNIHPPLYFFILKGWLALAGLSLFTARYLSVVAAWLQVAAVYALAARWFSRRTALLAALFATFSAVSIIYAQEVRVYALLPLAYLALLALTNELIRADRSPPRAWITLGVVSWTALHLHYVAFFAVAYVSAWALLSFLRAHRWQSLRNLMVTQSIVALAAAPWFLAAIANWRAISGEASAGTFVAEAVPVRFLLAQVAAFHLTGLAGALSRPGLVALVAAAAASLTLLLLLRLAYRPTRAGALLMLSHWLVPLSSALLVWLVRSFSHPRYVAMFVPGLFLLAAFLILPPVAPPGGRPATLTRLLGAAAALLLLAASIWGAALYFFDPGAAKDDIRGAAALLQELAGPDDLILVPDTDFSLPFAYEGPATVAMPGVAGNAEAWDGLARLTAATPVVYTLDYERGTRDWQHRLPFALHKAGRQIETIELDDLILRVYALDESVTAPALAPIQADFGPLRLDAAWIEQGAEAGDAAAVALKWQVVDAQDEAAQVALRLVDLNEQEIAGEDDILVDAAGRPSDQWSPGSTVTTYHLLPLPPGTPPVRHELLLALYTTSEEQVLSYDLLDEQGAPQGQTLRLGDVQTASGPPLPPQAGQPLAPGLLLLEATVPPARAVPGDTVVVTLLWQATRPLPDLRPELQLLQSDVVLARNDQPPANGLYPTRRWGVGELLRETRLLRVPAESAGESTLALVLESERIDLGPLTIMAADRQFVAPPVATQVSAAFADVARLSGFELAERRFDADEKIPLTLVWQAGAGAGAADYTVFAHLLDDQGRLIAQHDGRPAQGQRPTSGWVDGEYVIDTHDLLFRDRAYNGSARLAVGLYDPQTGERLRLPDGSDRFILPGTVEIGPASD